MPYVIGQWIQELTCPDCKQHAIHYAGRDEYTCASCETNDPLSYDEVKPQTEG